MSRASHVHRKLTFRSPVLYGWEWVIHDIAAPEPGPHLCVMAGVHVNEVSSIDAALELVERFGAQLRRGTVSIMPLANPPALPHWSQYVCPIDNKNINFSFPGSADGTFSEAFADAVLNEWAVKADCLIDLHGGDLCENVARFAVAPMIGDPAFDAFNLALATAFAPQIVVRLDPSVALAKPGRSCTGRALQRKHAAFAEAGANGLIDARSVGFHRDGALRIAGLFGMIDAPPPQPAADPVIAGEYHWVRAQADGWCRYAVEPGDVVEEGQILAVIFNFGGERLREVRSPVDGHILWRCTHAAVSLTTSLLGIAAGVLPKESGRRGPLDRAGRW